MSDHKEHAARRKTERGVRIRAGKSSDFTNLGDEALRARLEAMPSWTCSSCGKKMRGVHWEPDLCPECEAQITIEARRSLPRDEVFKSTWVPLKHRAKPPWGKTDWPRDPRPGAADHDPAKWPEAAARLIGKPHKPGPRSVVFTGANDVGKSARAAELLFLLHRAGVFGGLWVSEADVLGEIDFAPWTVRPKEHAVKTAPVVVLDDVFSFQGGPAAVQTAAGKMLELVEARWSNPTLLTIYTTHRFLSVAKAQKSTETPRAEGDTAVEVARKEAARESVEVMAPAVFGRWKDGLIFDCGNVGHRGGWAK